MPLVGNLASATVPDVNALVSIATAVFVTPVTLQYASVVMTGI